MVGAIKLKKIPRNQLLKLKHVGRETSSEETLIETLNNLGVTVKRQFVDNKEHHRCRVCLKEGSIPIFDCKENLYEHLVNITSLQIERNDEFPKHLCLKCFSLLEGAILLRNTALQSDIELKLLLKSSDSEIITPIAAKSDLYIPTKLKVKSTKPEMEDVGSPVYFEVKKDVSIPNLNEIKGESKMSPDSEGDISTGNEDNSFIALDSPIKLQVKSIRKSVKIIKYNCKICDLNFKNFQEYEDHRITNEHKSKALWHPYHRPALKCGNKRVYKLYNYCSTCDQKFKTAREYKEHKLANEHKLRKIQCHFCHKMFLPSYIKRHIERHEKDHKVMCDICGKQSDKNTFAHHRLTHTDILPHKCTLCAYRGRSTSNLTLHMRSHTGERPYQCSQCPAAFISKSNLNKHTYTHGNADYKCEICCKAFKSPQYLDMHFKIVHTGLKEFVCEYCDKPFGYRKHMMRHQRRVHKRAKIRSGIIPTYLQLENQNQPNDNP